MATITRKHLENMAIRLQPQLLQAANEIWGGSSSAQTLGALNKIAYDSESLEQKQELDEDESIETAAFQKLGNQTGLRVTGDISGPMRYDGVEPILFAAMGYERPTPDNEEDGFSPESVGGSLFSHVWELDRNDRHNAEYRTAPDLTGITQASISFNATDRKNRAFTIGVVREINDHRFKDCMVQSFGFSGTAADKMIKWNVSVVGQKEERSDFSSSTWTAPTNHDSSKNVLFKDLTVKLGNLAARAVVDVVGFNVSVEIPHLIESTSESKEFISEPILNDNYVVTLELTLARHEVDTFKAALEASTVQACSLEFAAGSNTFKILFENMKIADAPIGDEGVPRHTLTFQCGPQPSGGTDFTSELGNHGLVMDGPIVLQLTSSNSDNWLRKE